MHRCSTVHLSCLCCLICRTCFSILLFLALQESLVPNGDVSDVKMVIGDDDVIDMKGDPHEVADIKTLVGKLLDKIQGNFIPTMKVTTSVDISEQ